MGESDSNNRAPWVLMWRVIEATEGGSDYLLNCKDVSTLHQDRLEYLLSHDDPSYGQEEREFGLWCSLHSDKSTGPCGFGRFAQGGNRRMGLDWRLDQTISVDIERALLACNPWQVRSTP